MRIDWEDALLVAGTMACTTDACLDSADAADVMLVRPDSIHSVHKPAINVRFMSVENSSLFVGTC